MSSQLVSIHGYFTFLSLTVLKGSALLIYLIKDLELHAVLQWKEER
jgi:hypothetical protein